jgi:hypothetical protein
MFNKQPRNTPSYARSIDEAANTPTGKYVREQYKIWQQEANRINKKVDEAVTKKSNPKDVTTPEQAAEALQNNPQAVGQPKTPKARAPRAKPFKKKGELQKFIPEGVGERVRGGIEIRGRLPEDVKTAWVNQFPAKERADARAWIDQVEQDVINRQQSLFHYTTTTGKNESPKGKFRHVTPEAAWRIGDNNKIFIRARDMDSINANIEVAMNEGKLKGKTKDQVLAEIEADLAQFEADPTHEVSDQTRALMGEKREGGKPLSGEWEGWTVPSGNERRSVKDWDVDTIIGYADAEGSGLFGQPRGQEGLVFANPKRVGGESIGQDRITNKAEFEKSPYLDADNSAIEDRAYDRILRNEYSILRRHEKEYGKTVNTDDFRKHFKKDGYEGHNAASVQEPASYLSKRMWSRVLQNPEPDAVFTAGGSGSGKSSGIENIPELQSKLDSAAAVMDSNLSGLSSSMKKIDEAVSAGKNVKVFFVYRDPLDAFENGIVKRMLKNKKEGGRLVPSSIAASNHIGSYETALKLQDMGIDVTFVDNSRGAGNSAIVSRFEMEKAAKLPSEAELKKKMDDIARRLHKEGKINDLQLKGYIE